MENEVAIVNLNMYEKTEDVLLPGKFSNPEAKASGIAILFSGENESLTSKEVDLLQLSIKILYSKVKSIDSISEFNKDGIDSDLKDFLCGTLMFNQWLFNSHSVNRGELKDFPCFDKIELKQKLLMLAEKL